MVERRLTARLRTALALLGIAGILTLAGCGGGSGAPNNPYTPPPPVIPDLKLYPAVATVYPGTPITLTVFGGVPPYRAFTTNATVLPVANIVNGDTIALLANPVTEVTTVNIGVLDSVGSIFEQDSVITVQPAPLLPSNITVTANPNPACDGTDGNLCSGGTGTATVRVTGPGGVGIKGRAVKFDVVQGQFSIVSTNPAQPLVSTLTVVTDVNGDAVVVLSVPADTPTQTGIIRATDLTTGSQITGSFKILQVTIGGAVLSVLPQGNTTITGPDTAHCSSGVTVSNYIFGGTPPYQVKVNFPQYVTLGGVPVLASGGVFTTTTNGGCFINLTYVITDATGRTIPNGAYPTVTNQLGTTAPAPPPPTTLIATPGAIAKANCIPSNTFQFILTGGTAPYSVVTSSTTSSTSVVLNPQTGIASGQAVTVSGITSPAATTITAYDASTPRQSTTVTIDCSGAPPPPTPPNLIIAPNNFNYSATTCVNQTSNFVVTGGTPPYSVFFASPRPGASISPSTLGASGQGFAVTGLTNGVLTTNITVADSSTPQLQSIATVTCPITSPPTGALTVTPGFNYTTAVPPTCVGQVSNFVITGGTPPYYVAFPTPPNAGAAINPTTVITTGGGFQVTGLRNTTSSPDPGQSVTNITVTDSATAPAVVIRTITCP
jgi:hypothetical protein